jgi:hypothetical protein
MTISAGSLVEPSTQAISLSDGRDPPAVRAKRRPSVDPEPIVGSNRDAVYLIRKPMATVPPQRTSPRPCLAGWLPVNGAGQRTLGGSRMLPDTPKIARLGWEKRD